MNIYIGLLFIIIATIIAGIVGKILYNIGKK